MVNLSIVQGVVDVVRVRNHICNLLVSCVVTGGVGRDVVLLGDVVARGGEGRLLPRP